MKLAWIFTAEGVDEETVKALTDRRVTLAALACVLSVTNDESPQPAVVRP